MSKFSTFIFLLLFVFTTASKAQTPEWLWAEAQTGGSAYTQAQQLSVSPTGGIYISGRFAGAITFGGLNASAAGTEAFTGKLDTSGKTTWFSTVTDIATNSYTYGFGRDNNNNTYNTGPGYIDRMDSNGVEYNHTGGDKWPVALSGGTGYDVKADKWGNIYLGGEYQNTLTIGTKSLTSISGSVDMFLAKFDSSGDCIWLVSGGGAGYDGVRALGIDGSGYIYACGSYSNDGTFGSQTAPTVTSGYPSIFVVKYDTSGNAIRVSTGTNAGFDTNAQYWRWEELAVDSSGDAYVAGNFKNSAQFGSIALPTANDLDIFVAKCHFDGKWEWAESIKSNAASENQAIGLAVDKATDLYVVGDFFGTAQFGNFSLTAASGGGSPYVAKYSNSTGDVQWVQTSTGGGNAELQGVGIGNDGSVYIDGLLGSGTETFGAYTLTGIAGGGQNILVAKLGTVPPRAILPTLAREYCPGETVNIPYTLIGTFNSGNVFTAEISDSTGNFIADVPIGSVTSNTNGSISVTIPQGTPTGTHYFIRIVSSSPATSSYAAPNGNVVNGTYNPGFFITIGGGSTKATVSNDTLICSGADVQLHVSGGSTYLWSPGVTLNDSTSANPYAAPTHNQVYTVIATGCGIDTEKVTVNVTPRITLSVTPSPVTGCSGSQVPLSVGGATTYSWSPVAGLDNPNTGNPTATLDTSITYTVIANTGACTDTGTVTVIAGNTAVGGLVTAVRDTICQNTPGNLTLTGNIGSPLQWQSSTDSIHYTSVNDTLASYKTAPLQQTTWYHVIVGKGNCTALSDSLKLYVPPALTASFYSTQTSGGTTLTFNSDSSSGNIRSYHWDFGDGQTSNDSNPSHTYAKDSTYYVCLTLYDGSNCSYTFCRYSLADGIPIVSAAGNWIVYPDPFTNQLTISAKQANNPIRAIEMYDVLGQLVVNKTLDNSTNTTIQLDASSLAKGMYYVMIRTASADYVQKVVKQ